MKNEKEVKLEKQINDLRRNLKIKENLLFETQNKNEIENSRKLVGRCFYNKKSNEYLKIIKIRYDCDIYTLEAMVIENNHIFLMFHSYNFVINNCKEIKKIDFEEKFYRVFRNFSKIANIKNSQLHNPARQEKQNKEKKK